MTHTIVVIGGGHAGLTAASRARQTHEKAQIVLLEKSSHIAWVQADLRHYLEGDLENFKKFLSEKESFFSKYHNIEIRLNAEAIGLDMDSKFVELMQNNRVERIRFDAVVYAAGSYSRNIKIDGFSGDGIYHFRSLNDIIKIKSAIEQGAKKAVVLGCGFYGLEAAQGLKNAGLSVELVEQSSRILPRFSLSMSQGIVQKLREQGIVLHLADLLVHAHTQKEGGFDLELSSGKRICADIVIVTIGSSPRTKLLEKTGAALQRDGSVRVDETLQTTLPSVYACGSSISVLQATTNERLWIPGPSVVERTAQIAGQNAANTSGNAPETLKPVTNTQILRVGDFWFARTGLTVFESRKYFGDGTVFTATVHSRTSEEWVNGEDITVSLIADRHSRAIIGGEVCGKSGVAGRIDVVSIATMEKWPPEKLVDIDMSYAPLLGPAFDPLKEAGLLMSLAFAEKTKPISGENLALWIAEQRPFTLLDVSKSKGKNFKWPEQVRHLPLENLREFAHEIQDNGPIVVSSRSGRRAYLAHRVLLQLGFTQVYHLDGGELTWSLLMGKGIEQRQT